MVVIDNKEQDRREYAMEQYAPFNPSIEPLDYGDYLFIGYNNVRVVFEYKTGSDFLNSINDENHHLSNQVYHMVTNFDYTFVIVQTEDLMKDMDELYYSTGISMSLPQVNGAIAEYSTTSTVLFAQTKYQAFDLMMRVAGKIFMHLPIRYKYGKKSTNSALNYLGAMKGVDKLAEDICRTLDLRTKADLDSLTKKDLMKVNKVGSKKADRILSELGVAHNEL
jgi:ERCC4-type nuclease